MLHCKNDPVIVVHLGNKVKQKESRTPPNPNTANLLIEDYVSYVLIEVYT